MAEFKKNVSPIDTGVARVRPVGPSSSGEALVQGISDLATAGLSVAKGRAEEAGVEAGLEQQGLDLTLETVNKETGELNQLIEDQLGAEKDKIEGPLNQQRVKELKDKALNSLALTDRHIQALIDSGTISSTEGNARRKIELAKKMNEGSNFLFRDEFINAMSSVTGGTTGAAANAFFKATPEEQRQAAIAKEQTKAVAEFEGKVTTLQQIFPEKSRGTIAFELRQQEEDARRLKELELAKAERGLNADESSRKFDLMTSGATRALEVQIGQMTPTGMLDGPAIRAVNTRIAQSVAALEEELANTKGLTIEDRSKIRSQIATWKKGMEARVALADERVANKEILENLNVVTSISGMASNPHAAILAKDNPKLFQEFTSRPVNAQVPWLKLRMTDESFQQMEITSQYIRDTASFYSEGKNYVADYKNAAAALVNKEAQQKLINNELRDKFITMYKKAPDVTAQSMRSKEWMMDTLGSKDMRYRDKTIEFMNTFKRTVQGVYVDYGSGEIKVESRMPEYGTRPKVYVNMPETIADIPEVSSGVKDVYKTFKEHKYLWSFDFDNAEDAFNAFINGQFELRPEDFQEDSLMKRGASDEDNLYKQRQTIEAQERRAAGVPETMEEKATRLTRESMNITEGTPLEGRNKEVTDEEENPDAGANDNPNAE